TGQPPERRDVGREEQLRRELVAGEAEFAAITAEIAKVAPSLSDLIGGGTMTLDELQARLGPDEAAVIVDVTPREGGRHYVIAVSRDRAEWAQLLWTADSFTGAVADLRASIGERLGTRSGMALRPRTGGDRGFDYGAAAWLYAETLGR